jgi:hypothetical protein
MMNSPPLKSTQNEGNGLPPSQTVGERIENQHGEEASLAQNLATAKEDSRRHEKAKIVKKVQVMILKAPQIWLIEAGNEWPYSYDMAIEKTGRR